MLRFPLTAIIGSDDVLRRFQKMESAVHENLRYDGSVAAARDSTASFYLKSANGTIWKVRITNAGALSTSTVTEVPQ